MKKENRIPFIGVFLAAGVSYLLIHFWLADMYARLLDVSRDTAYYSLVTLLVLLTAWRAWGAARGKDEVANWVAKRFKK
jgi:hypothetical protein